MVGSAFAGASIVALGAATNMPDAKAPDARVLQDLKTASLTADGIAERSTDTARASRSDDRDAAAQLPSDATLADAWALPIDDYNFTSGFELRFDGLHSGIDLAARPGTPYKAVHGGVVISEDDAYLGGLGKAVIVQHEDGTQTTYGHSSKVFVKKGQRVEAGEVLGLVGDTGHTMGGAHLHIEIRVNGSMVDPVPAMREHGVDIKLGVETIYSDHAAS